VQVTLIDQSDQLDAKQQTVQRFAEARPGDVQHVLRDVDFRRGANGEGRSSSTCPIPRPGSTSASRARC
jgi:hypothetical protein